MQFHPEFESRPGKALFCRARVRRGSLEPARSRGPGGDGRLRGFGMGITGQTPCPRARMCRGEGSVLLSAWRAVFDAANAEEVEALAGKEGIELAAVIQYLKCKDKKQRPPCVFIIEAARNSGGRLPSLVFDRVKREQNCVENELAQIARRLCFSAVWRNQSPVCVEQLIAQEYHVTLSN